jgi:adenine-specific DNA-methyltransferase
MSDITILQGDCLELLPTFGEGSVDCVVTDPPYGTQVDRDGYGRRQNYGDIGRFIANDSDLSAIEGMLGLIPAVLKPHSWVAVFCSPKRHGKAAGLLERCGFPVAGEVIWDKASPGLGGGIRYQHETILLAKHGNPTGKSSLFSVIRAHLSRADKHKRHPHEKPVEVMRRLVQYCCPEGGMVLDPFAGSGSTLVACRKTGRRGIGIELDPAYISIIKRRIEDAETPLFSGSIEAS